MSSSISARETIGRRPEKARKPGVPGATYRLQFNGEFTFANAWAIVSYLRDLGVTHLYASPLLKAGPESSHGYDTCSAGEISDALGGERAFNELSDALKENDLGLLLDIVPNHMGASSTNVWWWDVLKRGRKSEYARYFDIDWDAIEAKDKVLLPVLGKRLGDVLLAGEIKLLKIEGEHQLGYFDSRFPLSPETPAYLLERIANALMDEAPRSSAEALLALLDAQHYRLAYWRVGREEGNYRRFFDVSSLVALRMEDSAVFQSAHEKIASLIASGNVDGLRVDHPDGLREPKEYFDRLRSLNRSGIYVVVEKILSGSETLPEDWAVHGTTGYDFLNQANGLFVAQENERGIDAFYGEFTGNSERYDDLAYRCKKQILELSFQGEVDRLADRARELANHGLAGRDLTWRELRLAIVELIACMPVYRTYVDEKTAELSPRDKNVLSRTADEAIRRAPASRPALDFIISVLSLSDGLQGSAQARDFVLRFQQLSGPATAKGLEDTAFYNYNRLVSLNEVGGEPGTFGMSVDEFHLACRERCEKWPHSLLATATHDTKRGEDVRARLNVVSEIPEQWKETVARWREWNRDFKRNGAPDANDEYLIYQTLVSAFNEREPLKQFEERVKAYMLKASREAKRNTSWLAPNEPYESATRSFVEGILDSKRSERFLEDLRAFASDIQFFGRFNSVSQTLLKIASPGAPDFYQGTELWDLSLVDPDNRRPVDFSLRRQLLDSFQRSRPQGAHCARLMEDPHGAAKLFLIWAALQCRNANRELFDGGDYAPLAIVSSAGLERHLCAFARIKEEKMALALAPRFVRTLVGGERIGPGREHWGDAEIQLPPAQAGASLSNGITGAEVRARSGRLRVADLLADFPVALLITRS